ncbi:energy-converting hydrogenase Eha subunit C [Desulfobaculum xiamenense]|uniref:Energy-converting hydrogenase Eha subunit C n=1 Tax=Desulfobaculum xiamenense TaxID=995050 RepID=A0A846QHS7_9BACT|nr:hypothetical protein [Desulfobaculum xiamenense]NJB68396.1 energy-converting hydrogenase Eha subunit C [Desulfobaculum xiamenense]
MPTDHSWWALAAGLTLQGWFAAQVILHDRPRPPAIFAAVIGMLCCLAAAWHRHDIVLATGQCLAACASLLLYLRRPAQPGRRS